MSHELRTTVTAIEGFAGLLDADPLELDLERRTDYVERIRRNARDRWVCSSRTCLDFARFERSGIAVTMSPIDLSDLVPQVVDQMSSLLGDRAVTLDITPGVVAMGDLSAVERILVNLLSNAAKYTRSTRRSTSPSIARRAMPCSRWPITDLAFPKKNGNASSSCSIESTTPRRAARVASASAWPSLDSSSVQLEGTIVAGETPGGGASFRVSIPLASGLPPTPPSLASATT